MATVEVTILTGIASRHGLPPGNGATTDRHPGETRLLTTEWVLLTSDDAFVDDSEQKEEERTLARSL